MKYAGSPLVTTASILMIGRVGDILGMALSDPLADLLKRRIVAYAAIAITTLVSYPFVLAIVGKRIVPVILLQFLINFFGIGLLHGLAPILTSESFPTKYRYSGTGSSESLTVFRPFWAE
jgi:MFS family permease